jgi:hypothetical protein
VLRSLRSAGFRESLLCRMRRRRDCRSSAMVCQSRLSGGGREKIISSVKKTTMPPASQDNDMIALWPGRRKATFAMLVNNCSLQSIAAWQPGNGGGAMIRPTDVVVQYSPCTNLAPGVFYASASGCKLPARGPGRNPRGKGQGLKPARPALQRLVFRALRFSGRIAQINWHSNCYTLLRKAKKYPASPLQVMRNPATEQTAGRHALRVPSRIAGQISLHRKAEGSLPWA